MDDVTCDRTANPAVPWARRALALLLVVISFVVYANSMGGQWVLDDGLAITSNPAIRHFRPWGTLLFPDAHSPLVGRPLASLSFALNYAIGGTHVGGYHVVNYALHVCAGLVLFGLVRRTLARGKGVGSGATRASSRELELEATLLAFVIAAWWVAHPLMTGTVTYVSQRTEGMMALWYLLTLYAFVRGAKPDASSTRWLGLSVVCCALGMATKEVMVTAPVLVLLYDRCFLSGSVREALRLRRGYYVALFANWILLAVLMRTGAGQRGVGFGHDVKWMTYAQTECFAVVRYAWLTLWPNDLVFDYGPQFVTGGAALPFVFVLVALLAAMVFALWRWPRVGFVAASYFILLAPTSSIVPVVGQPIAENRVYLPSIAVVTLLAIALRVAIGWRGVLLAGIALMVASGAVAHHRNALYGSPVALWADAARKWPRNPRAHTNLGTEYFTSGDLVRAAVCFEKALELDPRWVNALINLGSIFGRRGELERGIALQEQAVAVDPGHAPAHFELGNSLYRAGRKAEAVRSYENAVGLRPDDAEAHCNLALALSDLNRGPESVAHFERVLWLRPDFAEGSHAFGVALARMGRMAEAIPLYERALQLQPQHAMARHNYAVALFEAGRLEDAIVQEKEALHIDPTFALAHANLAGILLQRNSPAEALAHAESAVRYDPDLPQGYAVAGRVMLQLGRTPEAATRFAIAVARWPNVPELRSALGIALYQQGRFTEAVGEFETACRLLPENGDNLKNLASGLSQVGRDAEAIDRFRAALQLNDRDADTHRDLALVLAKVGRVEEAAGEFEATLRLRPDDSLAREQLARIHQERKDTPAKKP